MDKQHEKKSYKYSKNVLRWTYTSIQRQQYLKSITFENVKLLGHTWIPDLRKKSLASTADWSVNRCLEKTEILEWITKKKKKTPWSKKTSYKEPFQTITDS